MRANGTTETGKLIAPAIIAPWWSVLIWAWIANSFWAYFQRAWHYIAYSATIHETRAAYLASIRQREWLRMFAATQAMVMFYVAWFFHSSFLIPQLTRSQKVGIQATRDQVAPVARVAQSVANHPMRVDVHGKLVRVAGYCFACGTEGAHNFHSGTDIFTGGSSREPGRPTSVSASTLNA